MGTYTGVQSFLKAGVETPVADTEPLPVSASVTATATGVPFTPNGTISSLGTVTNTSAPFTMPANAGVVLFSNVSTVGAYVKFATGTTAATAADILIPPGPVSIGFGVGTNTIANMIVSSGSAIVGMSGGSGVMSGVGGAGSGGGGVSSTVTLAAGTANVGTVVAGGTVAVSGTVPISGTATIVPSGTQTIAGTTTLAAGTANVGTVVVGGTVAVSGTVPVSVAGTGTVSGTIGVTGIVGSGTTVSGGLLRTGARAATADPTAVTDGQAVDILADPIGRIINWGYALPADALRGFITSTVTSAVTLFAAAGSGVANYLSSIELGNTSTTAAVITLNDSASTQLIVPATFGNNVQFNPPLKTAANTALTFTSSAAISTILAAAQGFKGV